MADAQRRMHQATGEASMLRRQLTAILTHPELGPIAKPVIDGTAGTPGGKDPIAEAFERYKGAPDDASAFRTLFEATTKAAESNLMNQLTDQALQQENQQRAVRRATAVKSAVAEALKAEAPDVDSNLFWAFAPQAQRETPMFITDPAERIEWQKNRAIELARGVVGAATKNASTAAAEQERIRQSGAGAMPAGTGATPPPAPATTPETPLTFAEQAQRNKVRIGPA